LLLLPNLRTIHFGKNWVSLADGRLGDFANDFFEYLETQSFCPSLGVLILGMDHEPCHRVGQEERLNSSEVGPAHPRSFQKRQYFKRAKKLRDGVWCAVAVSVKLSWLQDNETLDILGCDIYQAWPAGFPAWRREV
jgi:hypothetical protein